MRYVERPSFFNATLDVIQHHFPRVIRRIPIGTSNEFVAVMVTRPFLDQFFSSKSRQSQRRLPRGIRRVSTETNNEFVAVMVTHPFLNQFSSLA